MKHENRALLIKRVFLCILFLNWFVSLAKLIFGYKIKSNSMVADGFHSLSDGASNIIGLFGIWFASRPKDESHPYGHKKYETFASIGIAFLLFLVSIGIIHESMGRFNNPVAMGSTFLGLVVIFITLGINISVMLYEYRLGRKLNSDILIADSMHTRADILTSCSVIFALIAVKLGWYALDPIIAMFIAVFILYSAFEIIKDSSLVLCDRAVLDSKKIESLVMAIEGVRSVHKIRTRGRCDDIHVDLHVLVNKDTRMDAAHKLSGIIEEEIEKNVEGVSDVVVHMEPYDT
ncbi:MAG: cation-efflux pump [Candidatus Omnitrophica bacterium CG11_big_fil_rev_8_21_14_0_20_42_13]|uniref:Cation-efflux pump n=1 Tax=Candidatus Ghiorseimicrobium undicola TaxID=1974746 RepID=A0A2H0LY87_9BACT|nr:MAG: cation-efflux pump [Candidatus Omnitrophica bacterium CG11_big_fil_rev_8_21_14_0_20_42_13]